jgi:hypothetical protein
MVDAPLEDRVKKALGFHASARFPGIRRPVSGESATT